MSAGYPKLPELWDVKDRKPVEQPDMTVNHIVAQSSHAGISRFEAAIRSMPPDAAARYARALHTAESILYYAERSVAARRAS